MIEVLIEIIGAAAAIALLVAYFLITTRRISSESLLYQGLNLLGALLLCGYGAYKAAWANVALNLVWTGVAIVGVITWARYRRKTSVKLKKV